MSDPTFIESWVCVARAERYELPHMPPLVLDEAALYRMVENFKCPMLVDVDFRSFEALGQPVPPSGAEVVAVEVRRDECGAYLAGLIRTPVVTFAIRMNARDRETGMPIGPRLAALSFTRSPLLPIERATDPGADPPHDPNTCKKCGLLLTTNGFNDNRDGSSLCWCSDEDDASEEPLAGTLGEIRYESGVVNPLGTPLRKVLLG